MTYLIILTFVLAPTYTVRFNLFGFPANLLMVWVVFVWIAFIIHISLPKVWGDSRRPERLEILTWKSFFFFLKNLDKKLLVLVVLFFLAGVISLFTESFDQQKIGQFIVLLLQPISIFLIAGFVFSKNPKGKSFLLIACYLLLASMGIYAIVQYFTLLGLPPTYWGNSEEPKRALGFFSHPNFYALFSAPLLALLVPDVFASLKTKSFTPLNATPQQFAKGKLFNGINLKAILWFFGAVGLLLSMSRAGWLGLIVAIAIYLIVAGDKKIKKMVVALGIIVLITVISIPNLRWRFILPFYGEKSAVSRVSLWQTGVKAIKESPVLGLGLTGFAKNWDRLNTDPNIDRHNFPHNIFLNFWVETGLLGLVSMIILIAICIYRGLKKRSPPQEVGRGWGEVDVIRFGISLFLISLIVQGLIDNPYFKNDLAMVFWIVLSLGI